MDSNKSTGPTVYQASSLLGKGTFGRVYSAIEKPTIHSALKPTDGKCLRLVAKECSITSELMLEEDETYGSFKLAERHPSLMMAPAGFLGGRVSRNRELHALKTLTTEIDPLTEVSIDEEGEVLIGEISAKFPVIPRLLDSFYSFDAGDTNWRSIHDYDSSGDIGLVTNDAFTREVIRQLLMLFAELHGNGYSHRDFKPHNALIEMQSDGYPLVRLCDVGSAKRTRPVVDSAGGRVHPGDVGATELSTPYITSRYYRAPELLCGSLHYGTPVDIWALGVSITEIICMSASLCRIAAAKAISLNRGDGRRGSAAEADFPLTADLPLPKSKEAAAADFGPKPVLPKKEVSARSHCTIFHGASSDGAQLVHVINLLGTPSPEDVEGMRLPDDCAHKLEKIVDLVHSHLPSKADCLGSLDLVELLARKWVPRDLAHLVQQMLHWDPRRRVTAKEALSHPALNAHPYIPQALRAMMSRPDHKEKAYPLRTT